MPSFTFKCDHGDGKVVTFDINEDFLDEIITDFEYFLKGCGFHFDGRLEFVNDETIVQEQESVFKDNNMNMDNSNINLDNMSVTFSEPSLSIFPTSDGEIDFSRDPNSFGDDIFIQIDDTPQPTYSIAGSLDDDLYSRR